MRVQVAHIKINTIQSISKLNLIKSSFISQSTKVQIVGSPSCQQAQNLIQQLIKNWVDFSNTKYESSFAFHILFLNIIFRSSMDYQERLESLSAMFVQSLEQIQLSRTLAEMNTVDLAKYRIQYIGQIIKVNIYNQKEKYILKLLDQMQDLKKINKTDNFLQRQLKYRKEIQALKKQLEVKSDEKKYSKVEVVDNELRGLIQQKMQQLQKDYILKVIHEQQLKAFQKKFNLANQNYANLQQTTECLKEENDTLKVQIQRRVCYQEVKRRDTDRSPVKQLDQLYSAFISPVTRLSTVEIQPIKQIPLQFLINPQPDLCVPIQSGLRRSKSIQSFNNLKDNFQRQLIQLKQCLSAKQTKIIRSKEQLKLSREVYLPSNYIDAPLIREDGRLKTNRINGSQLDNYTFGSNLCSTSIKKTTRGSQRVFNARKTGNNNFSSQESGSFMKYRYIK